LLMLLIIQVGALSRMLVVHIRMTKKIKEIWGKDHVNQKSSWATVLGVSPLMFSRSLGEGEGNGTGKGISRKSFTLKKKKKRSKTRIPSLWIDFAFEPRKGMNLKWLLKVLTAAFGVKVFSLL
jgi:hypothetical protein